MLEISGIDGLAQAADEIMSHLKQPRVVLVKGEMGAGKTTLIKLICSRLGSSDEVTSPTYALVNEYTYSNESKSVGTIYHLDLYRLKSLEESLAMGIEDYLFSGAYCFIEWPDLIEGILPEDYCQIKIENTGETSRKILIL